MLVVNSVNGDNQRKCNGWYCICDSWWVFYLWWRKSMVVEIGHGGEVVDSCGGCGLDSTVDDNWRVYDVIVGSSANCDDIIY